MSSAVISTSAAQSRPFIFDDVSNPDVGTATLGCPAERSSTDCRQHLVHSAINHQKLPPASVTRASQLAVRPTPEIAPSGIPALDALTGGGLPRGCLTEICGPASSGRTTILLAALAAATRRGEYCAVIDASDALDPHSVAAAGVELDRLLWVRCNENSPRSHRGTEKKNPTDRSQTGWTASGRFYQKWRFSPQAALNFDLSKKNRSNEKTGYPNFDQAQSNAFQHRLEQVLRATDLLLESGGFGLIILDLADIPPQCARRIPLTTWFRFRRAVEHKPTILLAIEQHPIAGSCSSMLLQLGMASLRNTDSLKVGAPDESAAKRRKNTAHACPERSRRGESRGLDVAHPQAPEGRKKISDGRLTVFDCNSNHPTHANLLCELEIHVELIRSRLDRKPACSVRFESKTAWAG